MTKQPILRGLSFLLLFVCGFLGPASTASVRAEATGNTGPASFEALSPPPQVSPASAYTILTSQENKAIAPQSLSEAFSFGVGGSQAAPDAEIIELARALRHDVDLIYEFVHDQIVFEPMYGVVKGPLGTLIDRRGNAFDQAGLMVALLRASGYTASFVHGTVRYTGQQLQDWLGISNSPAVAQLLLRAGGIPEITYSSDGTANGDLVAADISHVWVKVNIDGTSYVFDPAFKEHDFTPPIDLTAATGYDRATFMSRALAGARQDETSIKEVNGTNIRADLAGFATDLVAHIRATQPSARLHDIIGGKTIRPDAAQIRQSSLPGQQGIFAEWTTSIPASFSTTVRIQVSGIDHTFTSDEIYGRRLTIFHDAANAPVLRLDGTLIASGAAAPTGSDLDLTFAIDHPYAALNGTYADATRTLSITAGGSYFIVNGWGGAGEGFIEKRRKFLAEYLHDGRAEDSEEVLGESLGIIAFTWLSEATRLGEINGAIAEAIDIQHHTVGVAGQNGAPFVDLQRTSSPINLTAYDPNGDQPFFRSLGGFLSGLEHASIEQSQPFDAVSTVKLIEATNSNQNKIFEVTSSNFASLQGKLKNYSSTLLASLEDTVNAGSRVLAPEVGNLLIDDWSGGAFFAIDDSTGALRYVIEGNLNGGYATTLGEFVLGELFSILGLEESSQNEQTDDPIDFTSGDFLSGNEDISIGSGSVPLGLALHRYYNSANKLVDGPLGLGWTHNLAIEARTASDGSQGMGVDSPIDAAAAIAAVLVTQDVLESGSSKDLLVTSMIVDNWLMDQLTDNVVNLVRPGHGGQYVKLPDGSFNPPPGVAATLTQELDGTYRLRTAGGTIADFNADGFIGLWEDPNGNRLNFNYDLTTGRLNSVSNSFGRALTFNYLGDRIDSISDGTGRSVSYDYDAAGNLASFTDADSNATTYVYDIAGRLTKIFLPAFPLDPIVSNVYDSLDRVKEQSNAGGHTFQYFFAGHRSEEVDPLGNERTLYFDAQGNKILEVDQLGNSTQSDYDGQDRLIGQTLPEGNRLEFEYDDLHNVTKVTHYPKPGSTAAPIVRSATYGTSFNRMTSQTDPLGRTTSFFYDTNGNLDRIEFPLVGGILPVRSFTYNTAGQVLTDTDAEGRVTRFVYDPATGSLSDAIVDDGAVNLNLTTSLGYDAVGNVTSRTDPEGHTATTVYDNQRRPTLATSPAPFNFQTRFSYFPDGTPARIERETGDPLAPWQTTSFTYSVSGKLKSVTDPEGDLTSFDYDALDRMMAVTDADLRMRDFEYDPAGRLFKVHQNIGGFLTQIEEYGYTANGQDQFVIDAEGDRTDFLYDGFDRLERTVFADSSFEELSYDDAGNVLQGRTRAGDLIGFSYDPLDRLATKTLPGLITYSFDYDLVGRPLSVTTPTGDFAYNYDTAGRLTDVTDPDLRTLAYEFDRNSRRTRLTYPDGFFVTYDYDALNRLTAINEAGTAALARYSYDSLSRLVTTDYDNGARSAYTFEIDDDIKQVVQSFLSGGEVTFDYLSSGTGQKISQIVSDDSYLWRPTADVSTSYTPAVLNVYASVDGVPFSYDGNGNLTDDGVGSFGYDAENQLTSAVTPTAVASYSYDPFGRRADKEVDGTVTAFLYDGDNLVAEYDGLGNLTARYVQGPGLDSPVLMERSGNRYYYHFDGSGSVVALSGASGLLVERYAYGPFGESSDTSFVANPYRYAARRLDEETGLYYYRARMYSAGLGRFLQPDPSGFADGLNLYAYVGNDPLNFVDPLGLGREGFFGFDLDSNLLADFSDFGTGALSDINHTYSLIEQDVSKFIDDPIGEGLEMLNSLPPTLGTIAPVLIEARGALKATGSLAKKKTSPVQLNKAQHDAYRDEIADLLRQEGRDVSTEVTKNTPFGKRVVDIEVSKNGQVLGGIEIKTGKNPRYRSSQRAKDAWLRMTGYHVDLVRQP